MIVVNVGPAIILRSLASVGVDEEKLREQLDDYINWIKEIEENCSS